MKGKGQTSSKKKITPMTQEQKDELLRQQDEKEKEERQRRIERDEKKALKHFRELSSISKKRLDDIIKREDSLSDIEKYNLLSEKVKKAESDLILIKKEKKANPSISKEEVEKYRVEYAIANKNLENFKKMLQKPRMKQDKKIQSPVERLKRNSSRLSSSTSASDLEERAIKEEKTDDELIKEEINGFVSLGFISTNSPESLFEQYIKIKKNQNSPIPSSNRASSSTWFRPISQSTSINLLDESADVDVEFDPKTKGKEQKGTGRKIKTKELLKMLEKYKK